MPIYKKGDVTNPGNYRPISLLPIFDKVFERLICKRLLSFWNKYEVLYRYQFAFRKHHSTTLALMEITDNIYKWLDDHNYVCGVYIDLQKAFDTVDHNILLSKLCNYGVRGTMLDWFKDYLSNRKQFTQLGENKSLIDNVSCGVPQGSVLGPLLFNIYVNDMENASPSSKIRLFADDTNIFMYNKNVVVLNDECQKTLNDVYEWMLANKLSVNLEKTNFSLFVPVKKASLHENKFELSLNSKSINRAKSVKYLGVFIDEDLKWIDHINHLYNNIKNMLVSFTKSGIKYQKVVLKIYTLQPFFQIFYIVLKYMLTLRNHICIIYAC